MGRLTILPNRTYPQSDPTRPTNDMRQHPTTAFPAYRSRMAAKARSPQYPCMSSH